MRALKRAWLLYRKIQSQRTHRVLSIDENQLLNWSSVTDEIYYLNRSPEIHKHALHIRQEAVVDSLIEAMISNSVEFVIKRQESTVVIPESVFDGVMFTTHPRDFF